jgi:hypothetical protein
MNSRCIALPLRQVIGEHRFLGPNHRGAGRVPSTAGEPISFHGGFRYAGTIIAAGIGDLDGGLFIRNSNCDRSGRRHFGIVVRGVSAATASAAGTAGAREARRHGSTAPARHRHGPLDARGVLPQWREL